MNTSMADIAARTSEWFPGRRYRFSTILRLCGRPMSLERAQACQRGRKWLAAHWNRNVLSIHHGESVRDAFQGQRGGTPGCCVNRAGIAVFSKPLPDDCGQVIGILQHAEDGMF